MRCYAKICQGTRTVQIPEYNNLGEVLNMDQVYYGNMLRPLL